MYQRQSIESLRCQGFLDQSSNEVQIDGVLPDKSASKALVVTQGFEERSVGVLEKFVDSGIVLRSLIINRYSDGDGPNSKYQSRFENAAEKVTPRRWSVVDNDYEGRWVQRAIAATDAEEIILDITGISNRGMFGALDVAAKSGRTFSLAYSEAAQYWPKEHDWQRLRKELSGHRTLAEIVDEKPWLFGYDHHVELIPGHEGYDSASSGRALIGFLPFKCARLAAVLGNEDYADFMFIAGRPRLPQNEWRFEALKTINENIIKGWPVVDIPTFGYRNALTELAKLLFAEGSLLERYNLHLAILGSKLQVVACWALSAIVPSITVITSVPSRYFPAAFSDGIGSQWMFPLSRPST
jgi:hypothetical protein